MSRVVTAQVRRSRSLIRTLTGRPAVKVTITHGNRAWSARARTLDKAWDGARAAASLFSDVTLPKHHPWHPAHMPVITPSTSTWDTEDVDALTAGDDAALDVDASVSGIDPATVRRGGARWGGRA